MVQISGSGHPRPSRNKSSERISHYALTFVERGTGVEVPQPDKNIRVRRKQERGRENDPSAERYRQRSLTMGCTINIPWHRYALIAELTQRLEGKSSQFGKTSLQKMIYLLQELSGVTTNYQFSLYTHGPFTGQLLGDLDLVEALGAVRVQYVISAFG